MLFEAPDESCWVGVLRLRLSIPGARSLKDKRRVVAKYRDRLRAKKNLSVAEVGHYDEHGSAIMAVASLSNDQRLLRSVLDQVAHDVGTWRGATVIDTWVEVQRPWDAGAESQYDEFING